MNVRQLLLPALLGIAVYYAVFGGEYNIFDVSAARAATVVELEALHGLRAQTDSLRLRVEALENDPFALEQLARERFGMIREGEVLYRFAPPR